MKTVKIDSLKLTNFKGIREMEISFNTDGETFITGDNASGKTTIFDAFTWLLFNKDSQGRTAFDIKTIDHQTGQAIPQIDHEVEGVLSIDNRRMKLRKTYREKWVKKRGNAEQTLEGHETVCFIDDLQIAVGEYNRRINDIIPEELFRLTTDPAHFNRLDPADRRNVLIALIGEITNEMIAEMNPDIAGVLAIINGYSPDEMKQKLNYNKSLLNREYESIPARIDEKTREIAEPEDWDAISGDIKEKQSQIESINQDIESITATNNKQREITQGLYNDIAELDREEFRLTTQARNEIDRKNAELNATPTRLKNIIDSLRRDFIRAENELSATIRTIDNREKTIAENDNKIDQLREGWTLTDSETFRIDPEALHCPTCGTEYQWDKAEEIREKSLSNFNRDKIAKLERIEKEALDIKKQNEDLLKEVQKEEEVRQRLMADRDHLQQEIQRHEDELKAHGLAEPFPYDYTEIAGLAELNKQRDEIRAKLSEMQNQQPSTDTKELQNKRAEIQREIDQLNIRLGRRESIRKAEQRIDELKKMQSDLGQQIADIERQEFLITEFQKTKIKEIEKAVNERFRIVRFRMFEPMVNGGEKPACDTMVDGVPFNNLNSAMKINAGIDIINTLCRHYEFRAPIFIDNRETVNILEQSESQIVNLVVTKSKLEIN